MTKPELIEKIKSLAIESKDYPGVSVVLNALAGSAMLDNENILARHVQDIVRNVILPKTKTEQSLHPDNNQN